jgi:hypothetical protein
MTGQLLDTLQTRAQELDPWKPDLDSIVAAGDRRVSRRRIGVGVAGVAAVAGALTVASVVGLGARGSSAVDPGFSGGTTSGHAHRHAHSHGHGLTRDNATATTLVHTRYFDVPPPPDGFHVVGSLPGFAAITRDGTVDDLYRDTVTSLPQADITQILRVQLYGYAADPWERQQDPSLGEALHYDGRTFFHNTTWDQDVDYVQYQREDGSWLRLQYPKQSHFATQDMVEYLDHVQVNPGAVPMGTGKPRG